MEQSKYPEHEKLKLHEVAHTVIMSFLEFVDSHKDAALCIEYDSMGEYNPASHKEKEQLLAEYFGVDYDKFHQEKEQMYQELVDAQNKLLAKDRKD